MRRRLSMLSIHSRKKRLGLQAREDAAKVHLMQLVVLLHPPLRRRRHGPRRDDDPPPPAACTWRGPRCQDGEGSWAGRRRPRSAMMRESVALRPGCDWEPALPRLARAPASATVPSRDEGAVLVDDRRRAHRIRVVPAPLIARGLTCRLWARSLSQSPSRWTSSMFSLSGKERNAPATSAAPGLTLNLDEGGAALDADESRMHAWSGTCFSVQMRPPPEMMLQRSLLSSADVAVGWLDTRRGRPRGFLCSAPSSSSPAAAAVRAMPTTTWCACSTVSAWQVSKLSATSAIELSDGCAL